MSKTRNEYAAELAKGTSISIPKAARVIDWLVIHGIDLDLSDVTNIKEPGWGRIMAYPLYEINADKKVRNYYTKKTVPTTYDGEVMLHDNDGTPHFVHVDDLLPPTDKAA